MNIHFIAIGGSVMHGLALSMAQAGHTVTGSDDNIYDPAKTRLEEAGILPPSIGWDASRIHDQLDAVILGMHAFEDNPELLKARELEIPFYSFPEFIYEQSRNKQRVVIAGSYGKSSITAMVMHVLARVGKKFDYLVGAPVKDFAFSVKLTEEAPVIILEGDEYLSSKIDPRPKFLLYKPHVCLINGIAWDHINVFPTEEVYVDQFIQLIRSLGKAADIIVNEDDDRLMKLVRKYEKPDTHYVHAFGCPSYKIKEGVYTVKIEGERTPVTVFGRHNMSNIAAAWEICQLMAVTPEDFRKYISTFEGAGIRLETIKDTDQHTVIRDYAHAPEKVRAAVEATREKYPKRHLTSCLELHTFSSLNPEFLPRYQGALKKADKAIVYVNKEVWERRRLEPMSEQTIRQAFDKKELIFVESLTDLEQQLNSRKDGITLMMSSGNFSGIDMASL